MDAASNTIDTLQGGPENKTVATLNARLQTVLGGLQNSLDAHHGWEGGYPAFELDETLQVSEQNLNAALGELSRRLHGENYPFFHPLYAGQMLKPPHPAAMIGYFAAMLVNPNNHALDGGPATARMESECIDELAKSFGFDTWLGHLTASGTIANLEALWVARELHPDKIVVYSEQSHYTHKRMCDLLKIKSVGVRTLPDGSMDLDALRPYLKTDKIGTLVITLGSTSLGAIDPLAEAIKLQEKYGFRIHVDAAYGGYYHLLKLKDPAFYHFNFISAADSVVVDPHKHGLQPYGCGCVIFRDPAVARHYEHDSPYTYYTQPSSATEVPTDEETESDRENEETETDRQHEEVEVGLQKASLKSARTLRHLGEITLECSRPGAAAAALWLTQQLFPLNELGMGLVLQKTRAAALAFAEAIEESPRYGLFLNPSLDIVTYYPCAPDTESLSALSDAVFEEAMAHPEQPAFVAKLTVTAEQFAALHPDITVNSDSVTILRSCLMKPEHLDWVPQLMANLEAALIRVNRAHPELPADGNC